MDFKSFDIPNEYLSDNCKLFVEGFKTYFGEDRVSAVLTTSAIEDIKDFLDNHLLPKTEEGIKQFVEEYHHKIIEDDVMVIVYFPKETVENERGRKETIYDLFLRVRPFQGDVIFALRTTYTRNQANCGYVHSHLPHGTTATWQNWCLGSGPIRNTLRNLHEDWLSRRIEPAMITLLCMELETLVRTESLQGGPYIRMESIGETSMHSFLPTIEIKPFNGFYRPSRAPRDRNLINVINIWEKSFFTNNKLKMKIVGERILPAESMENILINATNHAVRMMQNGELVIPDNLRNMAFSRFIFSEGELKMVVNGARRIGTQVGTKILTFKGKEFRMNILDERVQETDHSFLLFAPFDVLQRVVEYLLYINERYLNLGESLKEQK